MSLTGGVNKQVIFSKESAWGTAPASNSGKYLRRVTLDHELGNNPR